MKACYELTSVDDILMESIYKDKEFMEFSSVVSELTKFIDSSLFTEGVKDTTPDLKSIPGNIKKNTLETTKDVINAYDNVTYAGSNLVKSSWDIVMRAVNLAGRVLTYVINKVTGIPKFILKTGDRVMDIPGEIKAKIKGNITLHITASDIELIYNKMLMSQIREYITLSSSFSKGDFWSSMFHKRIDNSKKPKSGGSLLNQRLKTIESKNNTGYNFLIGENDMKLCRKMDKVYTHLQNIEFKPTIIHMNDQSTVNTYFGDEKSIKFTDNYGKDHESTYYEALNTIIKDLENMKGELKNIQELVGKKLKTTEANQSYNNLNGMGKYRISQTISQISKVVSIIGNFAKYIITDLNTINNNVNKILGNYDVSDISGKKAATTPSDKISSKL